MFVCVCARACIYIYISSVQFSRSVVSDSLHIYVYIWLPGWLKTVKNPPAMQETEV